MRKESGISRLNKFVWIKKFIVEWHFLWFLALRFGDLWFSIPKNVTVDAQIQVEMLTKVERQAEASDKKALLYKQQQQQRQGRDGQSRVSWVRKGERREEERSS